VREYSTAALTAVFTATGAVRRLSTAGEPLTPEVGEWTRERFGIDMHDHSDRPSDRPLSWFCGVLRGLLVEMVSGKSGRS
jgi:hypothetical protein